MGMAEDKLPAITPPGDNSSRPIIYLAGPITKTPDEESSAWRNSLISSFSESADFIDPRTTSILLRTKWEEGEINFYEYAEGVSQLDRQCILQSDAVLAMCNKPSAGTG